MGIDMEQKTVNRFVLILAVLLISVIFISMIRHFLMAILLAGIFSALLQPTYRWFERRFRGHKNLASLATILLVVLVILVPLMTLLGVITTQAIHVGKSVSPWIQKYLGQPDSFSELLGSIPFYDQIEPYRGTIFKKAGELVGTISMFLIDNLQSGAAMTVNFLFTVFIFLYTLFFFLIEGNKLLERILYYLPLEDKDEIRILERFTSVSRATLKGTAVIGILQGGISGIAFAVVGINSAVFWGTIMTVLSIIPGIGTALIWFPAGLILAATGHYVKAVGLILFCGVVVGSIDNLLRPRLVGKDTEMHELFIFFGTLGGIALFGIIGFIIGPIIAALFITVWEIYGEVFKDLLPEVKTIKKSIQQGKENRPESKKETTEE